MVKKLFFLVALGIFCFPTLNLARFSTVTCTQSKDTHSRQNTKKKGTQAYESLDWIKSWVVILGSHQRLTDAKNQQKILSTRKNLFTEVLNTNDFEKLAKDLFIVIAEKNLTKADAQKAASQLKKSGIECYYKDGGAFKTPSNTLKPPILNIVSNSIIFSDPYNMNLISAGEESQITFTLKNSGLGDGNNLILKVSASGSTQGITYSSNSKLPDIKVGEMKSVNIPISCGLNSVDGSAIFTIQVEEPNGFGTSPQQIEIPTKKFINPMLEVVDYSVSSNSGGNLRKKTPFDLQLLVQNTQSGTGEDVSISISLPVNVFCYSGNELNHFNKMNPGETKNIVYSIIVSDKFSNKTVPISIRIHEKTGRFSKDKEILLELNQPLSGEKIIFTEDRSEQKGTEIVIGSLSSDVDKNIPIALTQKPLTYALIIGNEDYSSYQPGLGKEINVDFAINDALIFKEYLVKGLGVPERQVKCISNATSAQLRQGLAWIINLAKFEQGKAELIFYYSGHGLPDPNTREPYIIPVDVSGSTFQDGIKLETVYKSLTENPVSRAIVILDACFSGGARNAGLVAMKSIKIKPKDDILSGNIIVLASSSGEEASGVYRDKQHGYLTYFLLKKIKESKGDISLSELFNDVSKEVEHETAIFGQPQTPKVQVSYEIENVWESWKLK